MVVTSHAQNDLTSLTKALSHARELRVLARCVVVVVASDDPAFLVAFAQSSDRGRLLVWSTRLLVVTRAPLHEVMRLLRQYWTFSMMNTMFLTPGVPASGHRWDTYTHLPYSQQGALTLPLPPAGGSDTSSSSGRWDTYTHLPYSQQGPQVVHVATWTPARGLVVLTQHHLFPQKFENFYGTILNVTVNFFKPIWMVVEERAADGSKVSRTTGRDYIILETIAGLLNFSFRAIPLSDKTEIMEDVQNRTSFLRSTKMALLFHLRQKLDSTFMIEESTMTFAMAKPLLPPRWQSLYHPFSGQVWAAVVGLLFLVPPTLLLVTLMISLVDRQRVRTCPSIVPQLFGEALSQYMGDCFRALCGTPDVGMYLSRDIVRYPDRGLKKTLTKPPSDIINASNPFAILEDECCRKTAVHSKGKVTKGVPVPQGAHKVKKVPKRILVVGDSQVARLEVTITPEEGEGRSPPGPLLVAQDVVGTLLGQDLTRRLPSRSSTQIVVGAWLVLAFIVGTAYRGNLTAFLTVLKYPARPENLEQLLKTDARVAMHRSLQDYFYNYYKHSNSTMFRELADRTYLVASHADGLQKAMNKTEAYVFEGALLRVLVAENYTRDDGWSPLYVARHPIQPGYAVWYAPRDAPYTHIIDRCLLAFHGAGLIQRWSQVVLEDARQRDRARRMEEARRKRRSKEGKMEMKEDVKDWMLVLEEETSGGLQPLSLTHLQGP
nr:uncharacterized protein LOC123772737 [Procambarus clarkii]